MTYDMTLPHRRFFYEIAQHPHGSTNEKPLSDYIVAFAKAHGLEYMQDELYNVIVRKPATPGYENAAVLAIQAHIDMVCEKNKGTEHNFETDPIRFVVGEDGWLRADGTTLGADDCTGVAYMLAILEDDTLEHPELECIFTTQEEIGMFGAMALKPEDIRAHRMVTLDGGGENNTLLTSAGGCRVNITRPVSREKNEKPCYAVRVRGLLGGHSGGEIHKEKGNANKLLVRVLKEARVAGFDFAVCELDGGLKSNAIPRECDAVIAFDGDAAALAAQVKASEQAIWQELEFSDAGFNVEFEAVAAAETALTAADSNALIDMMFLMPSGFIARSMAIEGLTVTSLNMGIVRLGESELGIEYSLRSMLQGSIENLVNQLTSLCGIFGASLARGAEYPGWKYSENSPMRDTMRAVVRDIYNEELNVTATHGGCECGVFSAIHSDMDIISIGPNMYDIHSPGEHLDLASCARVWQAVKAVIEEK
ncbi:MAG: beta-Ala-His dipeptidase [Oscillospiraceae bacterium]|nr:beta-Ala-His dipeptidase [Oscillospiraceae bacterium]